MLDDETTGDGEKDDKEGAVDSTGGHYNAWLELIKEADKANDVGDDDTTCKPCEGSLGMFKY